MDFHLVHASMASSEPGNAPLLSINLFIVLGGLISTFQCRPKMEICIKDVQMFHIRAKSAMKLQVFQLQMSFAAFQGHQKRCWYCVHRRVGACYKPLFHVLRFHTAVSRDHTTKVFSVGGHMTPGSCLVSVCKPVRHLNNTLNHRDEGQVLLAWS